LETLPLRSAARAAPSSMWNGCGSDVERLRVELARKLDVSSAETSIPP
jgi:hypothetical protein